MSRPPWPDSHKPLSDDPGTDLKPPVHEHIADVLVSQVPTPPHVKVLRRRSRAATPHPSTAVRSAVAAPMPRESAAYSCRLSTPPVSPHRRAGPPLIRPTVALPLGVVPSAASSAPGASRSSRAPGSSSTSALDGHADSPGAYRPRAPTCAPSAASSSSSTMLDNVAHPSRIVARSVSGPNAQSLHPCRWY